jgi:hypothetical protein
VAALDVAGEVLPHAQEHPLAAQRRQQGEPGRQQVRAQQPHGVDVAQRAPEGAQRAGHATQRRQRVRQARVVGQRHEIDRVRDAVVGAARLRVHAAEQHDPLHERPQAGDEREERALGVVGVAVAPVVVVGVDAEPHG